MDKTSIVLRSIREWHGDHSEAKSLFACISSVIKHGENTLSETCRTEIASLLAQCFQAVMQDQIERPNARS